MIGRIDDKNPLEGYEKKKINKLHLLIHPGFLLRRSEVSTLSYYDDKRDRYEELLDNYKEIARTMGKDELMIVFLNEPWKTVKRDVSKRYMRKIKEIKTILGDRMIVLTGYNGSTWESDTFYKKAKNVVEARGFTFDQDILSDAYGETIGYCVPKGAASFNENAGFRHKTAIIPEATDMRLPEYRTKTAEEHMEELRKAEEEVWEFIEVK